MKRVIEVAKFAYANKAEEPFQKPGCHDFWRCASSVLNEGKSAIPLLYNRPEVSSSTNKAKLFLKNFSKNWNFDYSCMFFLVFLSRTNLRLHNIHVTPKLVKKGITNLDLSKCLGVIAFLS